MCEFASFLHPLTDGRVPITIGSKGFVAFTNVTSIATKESFLLLHGKRFFDTLVNNISFDGRWVIIYFAANCHHNLHTGRGL
jgi:hypothetical protein